MNLIQVTDIQTGYLFRTKVPENPAGNVVVIQIKDCSAVNGIDWKNCVKTQLNQYVEGTITKSIRRPVLQALPLKIPLLSKQEIIISIMETLKQEKITALRLIENNEQLMNAINQNLN